MPSCHILAVNVASRLLSQNEVSPSLSVQTDRVELFIAIDGGLCINCALSTAQAHFAIFADATSYTRRALCA